MGISHNLVTSAWENGILVTRDLSQRVVDVLAPRKVILNPCQQASAATTVKFGADWLVTAVNSGAVTGGNVVTLTTGAADDDNTELATAVGWDPSKGLTLECQFAIGDVDETAINIGFNDAATEGADALPAMFATTTWTTAATDCAHIVWDADGTTDLLRAMVVNTNVDATALASAVAPLDGVYHTCKIEVAPPLGTASFWVDGVGLGAASLVLIPTVKFCAYLGVINHDEAAANTLLVKDCAIWQWTV